MPIPVKSDKEDAKIFWFQLPEIPKFNIKNTQGNKRYIYQNDRDDGASNFIEVEINEKYIANAIEERSKQLPVLIRNSINIIESIFLRRNLKNFIVRKINRKFLENKQTGHDVSIKDGAVIAKDDLSKYINHALKYLNKIPIESIDIDNIALTNGKCAFYILEHLSPESFCFFVPFTKKIAIEESGLFQDSLIVYVKD